MVAASSWRLRTGYGHRILWLVVYCFAKLDGQSYSFEDRRGTVIQESCSLFYGVDFGGLYSWLSMEFTRVSSRDANIYCLALIGRLGIGRISAI